MVYITGESFESLSRILFILALAAFAGGAVIGYPALSGNKNSTREGLASSLMLLSFFSAIAGIVSMMVQTMGIRSDYPWFYDASAMTIVLAILIAWVVSAFLPKAKKQEDGNAESLQELKN